VSLRRHPFLDGTDIIGMFDNSGNIVVKYTYDGGMNNLKMISYMSNLIIGPSLSKMLLISGVGAEIRWLIDKLIPEL